MKRIFLVITLITLLFTMPNSVNAQERFIWLVSSDTSTYLLDTQSISYQKPVIDCWIRQDLTQAERDNGVAFAKKVGSSNLVQVYSQCVFISWHFQYNTTKPNISRVTEALYYNKFGNVIFRHEHSSAWDGIAPGSVFEEMFSKTYDYVLDNKI